MDENQVIKDAIEWQSRMTKLLENTANKDHVKKHIELIGNLIKMAKGEKISATKHEISHDI